MRTVTATRTDGGNRSPCRCLRPQQRVLGTAQAQIAEWCARAGRLLWPRIFPRLHHRWTQPGRDLPVVYDDGLTEERVPLSRIAGHNGSSCGASGGVRSDGSWDPLQLDRRLTANGALRGVLRDVAAGGQSSTSTGERPVRRFACSGQLNGWAIGNCEVVAELPGGALRLRYDDGFEEDAPAGNVLPPGANTGDAPGKDFGYEGAAAAGAAAVAASSRRSEEDGEKSNTPLAPRRRSGVQAGMQVRKQFEQERKARLETLKLKPEDKMWAQQHGVAGDRGLFQAMIVRYRAGMPPQSSLAPSTIAMSDTPITVYVRCRPMLPDEKKAGLYTVVTPQCPEVGHNLVVHEPKTMVDLSKAMDNHTYRFDAAFGEQATNAQIFEVASSRWSAISSTRPTRPAPSTSPTAPASRMAKPDLARR